MAGLSTWYTLGTIGMLAGTLGLAYGFRLVPRSNRRRYSLLVAVPFIAVVAYALMALGYGSIETQTGDSLFIYRYIDWLLTTPLHVLYLGLLAGAATRAVYKSIGLMGATIVLGFGGAYAASPLKWLLFGAGGLTFAGVVYYTYAEFDTAAQGSPVLSTFRKLRAFVIVLWLIYPLIWVFAPVGLGLIQIGTSALVISYLDVVAKIGFGFIALSGQLSVQSTTTTTPTTAD
ncbi:bacteriorhodopsin [Halovenus rubra]|uniref:Bacteriorhodopsin n=2 Tax=Halovenus rubra TaxID=869890 RepID=A0ACC7E1Y1_9EURY|nr:bacteriorhodopsin [Halovenus rubra]